MYCDIAEEIYTSSYFLIWKIIPWRVSDIMDAISSSHGSDRRQETVRQENIEK